MPWSADHKRVIKKLEAAIRKGGLFAHAMPRGSGKTTIVEIACLWAILYGFRRFVCLIGATAERAMAMLRSIKLECECNDTLLEDFRAELFAIWALEGISNRARGQLYRDKPTRIAWKDERVVMPDVTGSSCAGATITATGLESGNIRGQKHRLPDGTVIRPDFALIDDPQTTESAWSISQSERREALLAGDVLGMAGPGKKISAVCCCTVIRPGDLADNILDRQKHPEWQGERTKMLYAMPSNTKLWERYSEIRSDDLRADGDGKRATAFYRRNRKAMDAGAKVAWKERHNDDELSAVQNAMNLYYFDRGAFFAEYQNEPLQEEVEGAVGITAARALECVNGLRKGDIPAKCTVLTGFIDVHLEILYWITVAWEPGFRGYVIDYGTWPDQQRAFFTLSTIRNTLGRTYNGKGPEAAIRAGLLDLIQRMAAFEWRRLDGATMNASRIAIDKGYKPDEVEQAIRASGHGGVVLPSRGVGIRAGDKPFSEYKRMRGDQEGYHWRLPRTSQARELRAVNTDVNFWKSFVVARLLTPVGDPASLSLWGKAPTHRLIAEHLAAEYAVKTEGRGRTVYDWKVRAGAPDNHWFDCLVGATVMASMCGIELAGTDMRQPTRKRYTAADLRRK